MTDHRDEVWNRIRTEVGADAQAEPALASFLHTTVLSHTRLEDALSFILASKLGSETITSLSLRELITRAFEDDRSIGVAVREDLRRQGLGKFLLAQLLRYLQDQYFGICEVQTLDQNQMAASLFRSVGFEQVDTGRIYKKS